MANTKKEEIEAKQAEAAVKAADAKVEEIKAKKLADKVKKHEERVVKHPKLGKVVNWFDDNKWTIVGAAATGGVSFVAGWFGHKIFSDKKAEEAAAVATDVTPTEEPEAPFETEA